MKVESFAGEHILKVIERAVATAQEHGCAVWIEFNGEVITLQPGDSPQRALDTWQERQDQRAREYRASPAYVRAATHRAERTRKAQEAINHLLLRLDAAVRGGLPEVLAWLAEFAGPADDSDVLIPHARLAGQLATVAPADTNVGRTDLDQPGQEAECARWVIGQAVAYLERGLAPHPILGDRASRTRQRLVGQA